MIITQTPLRISLLGGGTDFPDFYKKYGGCVLTIAIDKYVYCIIKERFDNKIYIGYSQKEIVDHIDQIKHDLAREALRLTGIKQGVELSFLADIPSQGSGLGSSSSFLVGLLQAFYLYQNQTFNTRKLARQACKIEIDILGQPIGVQDQYIAAFGGIKFISFHKKINVLGVALSSDIREELDNHLILFFTGQTRKSSTVLIKQKQNITNKTKVLKQMAQHAKIGHNLLQQGRFKDLGGLMDQSWQLKKTLASNISNPQIDQMYHLAKKTGAYGGKISGAGNGGFLTLLVPPEKKPAVKKALKKYHYLQPGLSFDGSKSIFNIRR